MKIDWFLEEDKRSDGLDLDAIIPDHDCRGAIPLYHKINRCWPFLHNLAGAHKLSGPPYNGHAGRSWFLTEFKMRKATHWNAAAERARRSGAVWGLVVYTHCVHSRLGKCNPAIHHVKGEWCEPRSHGCCLFFVEDVVLLCFFHLNLIISPE
jgi:hypothetical protein